VLLEFLEILKRGTFQLFFILRWF